MDLSAVIFVALALAWAVYLIPRALKHHDEMASDRLVEGHSDKVRVLSRGSRAEPEAGVGSTPMEPPPVSTPAAHLAVRPSLASARRAARNRRRVLYVLVLSLAVLSGLAYFAIVPWWSTAIPGGLIVLFLVVARVSVRRAARRRNAQRMVVRVDDSEAAPVPAVDVEAATSLTEQLADEDTVGVDRHEIEAALADEGSLWDPLPVTLPTYVGKARARRTVRTIELTGINSSGHDVSDSALARDAAEAAEQVEAAEQSEAEHRKAAGA